MAEVHPTDKELQAFAAGTVDDPSAAALESHLLACDACWGLIEEAQADHPLVRLLKSLPRESHAGLRCRPTDPATLIETTTTPPPELASHPRYQVIGFVGQGGMGQVWKARHLFMNRLVAVKVIRPALLQSPAAVSRFRHEVEAAARLDHPNIVRAFDAEEVGGLHFLVMEFVEGVDLAQLVRDQGPLPVAEACEYARQVAVALQHAHEKGLVHRDIKPSNLIVARPASDEPPLVKVLDFGLARVVEEGGRADRADRPGKVMGTIDFVAPEQATDPWAADIRADIYSLGCSLFYLLTGRPPFAGEDAVEEVEQRATPSVCEARPDVPPTLDRVIAKMMAGPPCERYQVPAEVATALLPFTVRAGEGPIAAGAGTVSPQDEEGGMTPPPHSRRRQYLLWGLGCGAAVLAGVVALLSLLPSGGPDGAETTERAFTNSLGMRLVLVPAGRVKMTSGREATISTPFYLGAYEVSQREFERVMKDNPSRFRKPDEAGGELPVENVIWEETVAFCDKLSSLLEEKRAGRSYRLPTEAEWEHAYRAGSETPHYFDTRQASDYAWTNVNAEERTHSVGKKKPNAWGLYDMCGNVWEWCSDYHDERTGTRVLRGGSLYNTVDLLRTYSDHDRRTFDFGFRVVCVVTPP